MKKIFIMAYARKNLGDDIFIKMLLERYPDFDFFIKTQEINFFNELNKYKNLHVLIGKDTDEELYNSIPEEYDAYVYIGGSIFMEGGKVYNLSPKFYDFVKRCKQKGIPFCYISSNYGPYRTEEYFNLSRENFKTCTDICFRDKYSYDLFKDIDNVRYAPDYIFNYDIKNQTKIPKSIGISVINLNIRDELKRFNDKYYIFLVNNIKQYIKNGYVVYLYSFCEYEGDEETINQILKEFNYDERVKGIRYNGNIDEFLNIYNKMEYMICARFHSMILSCISNQKMYITSYSKKINNVIDDLELELPVINFNEIEEDTTISLENFKSVNEDKIKKIVNESKEQEKVFKQILTLQAINCNK